MSFEDKKNNVVNIETEEYSYEASKSSEPPYRILPNKLLNNDYGLSAEALGVLCHLLHHKPGYKIHDSSLMKTFKFGRDKRKLIFKELTEKGFVKKTPVRDSLGRICGWSGKYSNFPEFLGSHHKPEKPSSGEFTTSLKSQRLAMPAAGKTAPNNTNCYNNTKNNNNSNKDVGVLNEMVEELKKNGVSGIHAERIARAYPEKRIREVLAWIPHQKTDSSGALICAAFRDNYNCEPPKTSAPAKEKPKRTREESLELYKSFWSTLDDEGKINRFKTCRKVNFVFSDLTKNYHEPNVVLESFVKTREFVFMADLEFPSGIR